MGWEFIGVFAGLGLVLLVASIGIWKTGDLRKLFDELPAIDEQVEKLADFYDKSYMDLKEKYDELKKKLDELIGKIGQ